MEISNIFSLLYYYYFAGHYHDYGSSNKSTTYHLAPRSATPPKGLHQAGPGSSRGARGDGAGGEGGLPAVLWSGKSSGSHVPTVIGSERALDFAGPSASLPPAPPPAHGGGGTMGSGGGGILGSKGHRQLPHHDDPRNDPRYLMPARGSSPPRGDHKTPPPSHTPHPRHKTTAADLAILDQQTRMRAQAAASIATDHTLQAPLDLGTPSKRKFEEDFGVNQTSASATDYHGTGGKGTAKEDASGVLFKVWPPTICHVNFSEKSLIRLVKANKHC